MSGIRYPNILLRGLVGLLTIGLCLCERETPLPVKADFEIFVKDNDYTVPVTVSVKNTSRGAETYKWTFEGADKETQSLRDPETVVFRIPGNRHIRLEVSNKDAGKDKKEIALLIDPAMKAKFDWQLQGSLSTPVTLKMINQSVGAATYSWTFSRGVPPTSEEKEPEVVFPEPGTHTITLTISNGREEHRAEKNITAAPEVEADFEWRVDFIDEDLQAPVVLHLKNTSIQANAYRWKIPGANPASSVDKDPVIVFQNPGDYTVSLEASNDKMTKTREKKITILPDTGLLSFKNISMGINTSDTFGHFFATTLNKMFLPKEEPGPLGSKIDIAFYGFNALFSQNSFLSPDNLGTTPFPAIAGAGKVFVINRQEALTKVLLSPAEFDALTHGDAFTTIAIDASNEDFSAFDKSICPRVVLFKTADGRKGAIKITGFVSQGRDSHITADIKIQKTP